MQVLLKKMEQELYRMHHKLEVARRNEVSKMLFFFFNQIVFFIKF